MFLSSVNCSWIGWVLTVVAFAAINFCFRRASSLRLVSAVQDSQLLVCPLLLSVSASVFAGFDCVSLSDSGVACSWCLWWSFGSILLTLAASSRCAAVFY
ncbi:hypothetical protein TSUD_257080 [Trifolium subterraneum]|uniref:Uncharacterized protein n=1 Tax=Trifolium subterraneum TaxID=3900 RepID=A0A2Z6MXE0_TRISU|nr:hypothetical protein TSUD_257080 [Trifolium subterraneum]